MNTKLLTVALCLAGATAACPSAPRPPRKDPEPDYDRAARQRMDAYIADRKEYHGRLTGDY